MISYLFRRLLLMIPTLLSISAIVFIIIQLPPGDYLETYISELRASGEAISQARVDFLRDQYGLDKPLIQQYFVWIYNILHGDFGYSFEYELPVTQLIGERLPLNVVLNFTTIVFIYVVSFPIAIYSATRQYSLGDYTVSILGFLGLATPNFLLALVLLWLSNAWFGTSVGGLMAPEYIGAPWSFGKFLSVCGHLIVPVLVIGTSGTASMIRRLRANLLDELQKQYVITGVAKGLPRRRLLLKYPVRMSLNPFISDIGSLLPSVVSGSSLVAVVMSLQTLGPLLVRALQSQDMYLAGAIVMFEAVLVVLGVLVSDLLLAVLDPRIRLQGGVRR
jgi:peptide/nickel transport system permease protein